MVEAGKDALWTSVKNCTQVPGGFLADRAAKLVPLLTGKSV
jgi:hypothetical protein